MKQAVTITPWVSSASLPLTCKATIHLQASQRPPTARSKRRKGLLSTRCWSGSLKKDKKGINIGVLRLEVAGVVAFFFNCQVSSQVTNIHVLLIGLFMPHVRICKVPHSASNRFWASGLFAVIFWISFCSAVRFSFCLAVYVKQSGLPTSLFCL